MGDVILQCVDLFQQLLAAKHLGHIVMAGDGLEVGGVDTEAVPALVVDLGCPWEEADEVVIGVAVSKPEPASAAHDGVASGVGCKLPFPTLGFGVRDRPLKDVIPSVVSLGRIDNEVIWVTSE